MQAGLKDALAFFESAGERPEADHLSADLGVKNAVLELKARRAQIATQAELDKPKGKQAPQLLVAQVVALEGVVGAEHVPRYVRFYAWTKLLRHWTSMRWDDTNGISPHKLRRRARGAFGQLERSKTSGRDKTVKLLPIFVSQDAWVSQEWLDRGLDLLANSDLAYKRDYLLPLPSPDLAGTCGLQAQYADALGLTRQLWGMLEVPGKPDALLLPEATKFWSEHSDRAGVTSWLLALGVPREQRDFLGRWAVSAMADKYSRTASAVVENLQIVAAKAARLVWNGGPDLFGEEEALENL